MTIKQAQQRLMAAGFPLPRFGADGDWGPETHAAFLQAMDELQVKRGGQSPVPTAARALPPQWLPAAKMDRVIVHWSAGGHKASALDKEHYHIIVEGDGALVRGDQPISHNQAPIHGPYAAHTLNCNGGSIGISAASMAGAIENPFDAGWAPLTRVQWGAMVDAIADLCTHYGIAVSPTTVLTHAEVQPNLGITQRGKWDITRLPFDPSVVGAKAVGDNLRREVTAAI